MTADGADLKAFEFHRAGGHVRHREEAQQHEGLAAGVEGHVLLAGRNEDELARLERDLAAPGPGGARGGRPGVVQPRPERGEPISPETGSNETRPGSPRRFASDCLISLAMSFPPREPSARMTQMLDLGRAAP